MATLEKLQERKSELEAKLFEGDFSVEPALARIDSAIAARTQQIQHSQKRLAAVRQAVRAGLPLEETTPAKVSASSKKAAKSRLKRPLNRF